MLSYSPLRYPGGKARVANFVGLLLQSNTLLNGEYVEPFAGGASVAFALLFGQYVSRVHINDADPAVYACWDAMLNHSEKFCSWLSDVPLTVDEWKRQRDVYRSTTSASFDLGCATFYLNRTNRSGVIVQGGLIGGLGQTGNWLMDARFNRADLVRRVRRIADYRAAVSLTNLTHRSYYADSEKG